MDWLASHNIMLDCYVKTITLVIPSISLVVLLGFVCRALTGIISYIQNQRLISTDCLAYLAHVHIVIAEAPTIESVLVVREFPDVFSVDLLG